MARTTGYTCNAALHLLIKKLFNDRGVFPPELVGKDEQCFKYILEYLKERNVIYNKTEN
jgi:saccharopine dehydrogenase-like NADP-dependent oxidoreductase